MSAFVWAVLAAVSWGLVPFIEKVGLLKIDPIVGLFYRCLGVIVGIVVLLLFKGPAIKHSFMNLHPGMAYLIAGGFIASIVGQFFFYHALKTGELSKIVPIGAIYPLFGFILGILFLGEKFTLAKGGGLACILIGVILLK